MSSIPYLIQRCTVKGGFQKTQKVSEYLSLDYMGSAEFEFGSIPKCLREFKARIDELTISTCVVVRKGKPCNVSVLALPGQLAVYDKFFKECANAESEYSGPRLKERISLTYVLGDFKSPNYWSDDFWIDIENCVAICQDRGQLENFKIAVVNSVKYMDEQKKLAAGG